MKRVSHFRKLIRQCTSADGEEYYPIPDSLQPEILDALEEACDLLESAQSETGDTARLDRLEELLRQARGWLSEWRGLLDHCGFQNATHIMRLEGVSKMIERIDAALAVNQSATGTKEKP